MGNKSTLDLIITGFCAAVAVLAYYYIEQSRVKFAVIAIAAVCGVSLAVCFVSDLRQELAAGRKTKKGLITQLVLLSEEDTELANWDIFGRVSLVIGKDWGKHSVDINLNQVKYAGMIEPEHAVLNYCDADWYIEDVGSTNGISIQKAADGKKYALTSGQPCKIDFGDVIFIGLTRLAVQ